MRSVLLIAVCFVVGVPIAVAADDLKPIFDGKTLNGWVQKGGQAEYRVEGGCIVGKTVIKTPNSFLCTAKDYADFILEFEFRVDPKLNSGVQIRSQCFDKDTEFEHAGKPVKIPAGRVHGYQCEIDPDLVRDRWWTAGIYDEGRRGWLFPGICGGDAKQFTEQGRKIFKRADWNRVRIEARGPSIKTWLNGEPRADFSDSTTLSGFIALQVHSHAEAGLEVRWRNIRLQDLAAIK
ncbi:MAG TPA: DUF1080 domain-containing protein [Verrucomicrobiae bacterium]|nr:DUF1080 domain-containing protein [Verrucomicrobiae bacterium]